jgi:hypothetical protein
MFSRKRKRCADTLAEQSEQIALFFAEIKDECGYSCVPTVNIDVRNEDVILAISGLEQLNFKMIQKLCQRFNTVSDVYCDLAGKTTYVTVERSNYELLSKLKKPLSNKEEASEAHAEMASIIKTVAKQDSHILAHILSKLKQTFEVGSFTKMKIDIINRPSLITVHTSNVRKIPAHFILQPFESSNYVDFERAVISCNIEK